MIHTYFIFKKDTGQYIAKRVTEGGRPRFDPDTNVFEKKEVPENVALEPKHFRFINNGFQELSQSEKDELNKPIAVK